MRIGILTHSTIPRGGVVHALELADALCRLGYDASVIAPATGDRTFFRSGPARRIPVDTKPGRDLADDVENRIAALVTFLDRDDAPDMDIWHAQDPISANALAVLCDRKRIPRFVRTVHHVDRHGDTRLDDWQRTGIERAANVFCVSTLWERTLREVYGVEAAVIGNGVDTTRFSPDPSPRDRAFADRLDLRPTDRPVFLSVGGIERRKNSLAILEAFLLVRAEFASARLVIAGGASLLDHRAARDAFEARLADADASDAVIRTGVVPDEDMPSLYRRIDALVFVSRAEGFGLCPLEAMASGRPTIVSDIPPFSEHFGRDECLWADPHDVGSIASAMRSAVSAPFAARLGASGPGTARRFDWTSIARRQLSLYGCDN